MIANIAKSIFTAIGVACIANYITQAIGSDYLIGFLKNNIVSLQIGLLAINTATLGVVLTKLRDLIDKGVSPSSFSKARSEMLLSIQEQVALIVLALVILSLDSARSISLEIPKGLTNTLLIACFTYSILILYDTAKSVFVVLGETAD